MASAGVLQSSPVILKIVFFLFLFSGLHSTIHGIIMHYLVCDETARIEMAFAWGQFVLKRICVICHFAPLVFV